VDGSYGTVVTWESSNTSAVSIDSTTGKASVTTTPTGDRQDCHTDAQGKEKRSSCRFWNLGDSHNHHDSAPRSRSSPCKGYRGCPGNRRIHCRSRAFRRWTELLPSGSQ
jgi:hypothetical protein